MSEGKENDLEVQTCKLVVDAKHSLATVRFVTGYRDALAAMCEELALVEQCMLSLAKEARSLRSHVTKLGKSF